MTNTAGPQFVISGVRDGTNPVYQGTLGRYWSSSAYTSATTAYNLGLDGINSAVYPAVSGYKRYGFPLRCLSQNQIKNRPGPNKRQNNKKEKKCL